MINEGKKYDYLIVGAGLFGSVCAYDLSKRGKTVLVIEKRNHIGGNCYTENWNGINVHLYGPHIFHTSKEWVWEWVNQFAEFNNFTLRPAANYKGEIYSLPFSMWTFSKIWNIVTPQQAKDCISKQGSYIENPQNLEEQAIKSVGYDVYKKLICGHTEKQWGRPCSELPASIIKRLPVRFNYDNNYFNDRYQGIPIGGYTQIFEQLLKGVDVKLNEDYLKNKEYWNYQAENIIYTGPIDRYYNYIHGPLEYKTMKFDFQYYDIENFQGVAMMNYTDEETPYHRVVEYKHFENIITSGTWVSYERLEHTTNESELFYPLNDEKNNELFKKYKKLQDDEKNVYIRGRLGEYKYYNMDKIIEIALDFLKNI